ncbi:EamA domain-containing protein [Stackebrandtia soli]
MTTVDTPLTRLRIPPWLAQALVVAGGGGAAAQAMINGELGTRLESSLWASAVSNTVGGSLFVIALLASPSVRRGLTALRGTVLPWWMFTGGVFGAIFVFAGATAVPLIGVALFTIAQVCGNTVGALGTDALGLGPSGRLRVTRNRTIGAVLAIVAVGIANTGRGGDLTLWWLVPVVALIGVGIALQGAFNGRVNDVTGNPLSTGLINFVIGTGVLYAIVAVVTLISGTPTGTWPSEPWLYLGGPCGAALVVVSMIAVKAIGVLRMALGVLAGQLAGAVVFDLLRTGEPARPAVLLAVALTAVAVAIAGRSGRTAVVTAPDEAVISNDERPESP